MTESNVFVKTGDKLVIATHNKGKLSEFQSVLATKGLTALSLADFTMDSPEETATNFEGNAKIKALAAAKATGLPALADDSGFCVEALDGHPGLFSARFMKECGGAEESFKKLHEEIQNSAQKDNKKAYFIAALCLAFPDGRSKCVIGKCEGTFSFPPKGNEGHGYDPVFVPESHSETFAQIGEEEKNKISHRGKALEAFFRECVRDNKS
ncbi:RdgB/HAM1 family non-canonical purine NTP pyrophosphatase [Acetobacteraceae bacterium]|nr:RdgB/HAM1 family non-canonical purine NTP pyrophosphatase [Acetobacteraceae bacterium]